MKPFVFFICLITSLSASSEADFSPEEFADTPYAFPESENGSITWDFLWWKPYANVPYACTYEKTTLPETNSTIYSNEKTKEMQLAFHPGFRVGIDLNLPVDSWKTSLQYTRFVAKDGTFFSPKQGRFFQGIWDTLGVIQESSLSPTVDVEQNINFNTVDINLLHTMYGKKFIYIPFVSLKAALIKNHLYPSYRAFEPATNALLKNTARLTSQYRGVGLRTGFLSDFVVNKMWKFSGKTAFSALLSRTTFRTENAYQIATSSAQNTGTVRSNAIRELHIQQVLELSFGTSFTYESVCNDRYLSISANYEAEIWPNHLYMQRLKPGGDAPIQYYRNALAFQGLTAKATLAF